jgi:class 3 adenylate cyclase/predicted alpha/beta hydrolase
MDVPETRYAKSGDVRIAYQVIGSGPLDLVFVPGFVSNLELMWENPAVVRLNARLAAFSRLIRFDKRGTGLSDRMAGIATLEERMDDVRAVMDAVGAQRAALLGIFEGGAMSMLFAATYPERTRALVLYGTYAHYPTWVLSPEKLESLVRTIDRGWGTGAITSEVFFPGRMPDAAARRDWGRFERLSASPSAAIALQRMNSEIDVRKILPAIRVPTLVLHQSDDPRVNVAAARYLVDKIPGAKYAELPGSDYLPMVGDTDCIADEVEEFLTGSRTAAEPDRVLATVLFTDIVDSTKRAAELGDRDWRLLRDRHDDAIRQELARYRGREVKTLGDGFLATFDGPARAVRCASAIVERVRPLGVDVRSGLHTGEIEIQRDDIGGIAVHIAARVADMAGVGEVLVSSTVRDLVAGSGLRFHDRGSHALKGLPEPLHLFAAEG